MQMSGRGAAEARERRPIDICMRYLSAQLDAGATLRANGTLSNDRVRPLERLRPPRNRDHTVTRTLNITI